MNNEIIYESEVPHESGRVSDNPNDLSSRGEAMNFMTKVNNLRGESKIGLNLEARSSIVSL